MRNGTIGVIGIFVGIAAAFGAPSHNPPTAIQLRDRMIRAYQNQDQYVAVKTITQTIGGQSTTLPAMTFKFAVDRVGKRIAIQTEEMRLVGSENQIRMSLKEPGPMYYRAETTNPLSMQAISAGWPGEIFFLWMPDMALLLDATQFQSLFKDATLTFIKPRKGDPQKLQGLVMATPSIQMTLWLDPQSGLVKQAKLMPLPTPTDPSQAVAMMIDLNIHPTTGPLSKSLFAFDAGNAKPASSLGEMFAGPDSAYQLQGKPAPGITLPLLGGGQFDLAKVKTKVVVLDFWATWCGPCRRSLAELEALASWAKDQKLDVSFYAVNQQESIETVTQFVTAHKMKVPVLLDQTGVASDRYRVQPIPQSVIIRDGKIMRINIGFSPQIGAQMKKDILKWSAK